MLFVVAYIVIALIFAYCLARMTGEVEDEVLWFSVIWPVTLCLVFVFFIINKGAEAGKRDKAKKEKQ